jgi:hypothetical protein
MCNALLQKLWAAWNVQAGQSVTWRQFMNQLSPTGETKEAMLARLPVQLSAANLTAEDMQIISDLKDREHFVQLDNFPVNCDLLSKIRVASLTDDGSDDDAASSSSDDADEEEDAGQGGFVPVATVTQPTVINGLPPAPSIADVFGASVPAQPAFQPVAPVQPTFPGGSGLPTFGQPTFPTQPTAVAVQGEDMPYVMAYVSSIRPSDESRFIMVEIPEVDAAGVVFNTMKVGLFITAGNLPSRVTHTFFATEDPSNQQQAAIRSQNAARVANAQLPNELFLMSDGVTPDAIAAGKAIKLESTIKINQPLPNQGKSSKPRSNRPSAPAPASGGFANWGPMSGPLLGGPSQPVPIFGANVPGPTSGPISGGSAGLPMDFATGQPLPLPPGAQIVKALNMQADKKNAIPLPDPATAIDMVWLPGGPRPFGMDTAGGSTKKKYFWFIKSDGSVVKSDNKTATAAQAVDLKGPTKHATNQQKAIEVGRQILQAWHGNAPNWYMVAATPFPSVTQIPGPMFASVQPQLQQPVAPSQGGFFGIPATQPAQPAAAPSVSSFFSSFGQQPVATAPAPAVQQPQQPSNFGMATQIASNFPVVGIPATQLQAPAAPSVSSFFAGFGQTPAPQATVPVATAVPLQGSGGATAPAPSVFSGFGAMPAQPTAPTGGFSFLSQLPSANQ